MLVQNKARFKRRPSRRCSFQEPPYAATLVIGGHTNGLTDWKTAEGKTHKEIEKSEQ
jgi:hypothetical protein